MASSVEPTVRTPFTLVETSTLDDKWNTSVTFSFSTNYKEYKTVEVRTANCKEELYEQDMQLYSRLPPVRGMGPHPLSAYWEHVLVILNSS